MFLFKTTPLGYCIYLKSRYESELNCTFFFEISVGICFELVMFLSDILFVSMCLPLIAILQFNPYIAIK
jgi:hypothetical protein